MYQLIVFDWDGTLMDSAQKIANCIKAAACESGVREPSDENAKNIIGLGLVEAMQALFPYESEASVAKIVESYKYHFVTGDLTGQGIFDGVEAGLEALAESGVLMAVATGKSRRGLDRVFHEVGLEHHFVVSRCADETRSKPHPQMLYEILDYTAIDPHKSIMIGDTTYDMQMAGNAGMHALGAAYGVHDEQSLRQANAVDVLGSFPEIVNWLLDARLVSAYG